MQSQGQVMCLSAVTVDSQPPKQECVACRRDQSGNV